MNRSITACALCFALALHDAAAATVSGDRGGSFNESSLDLLARADYFRSSKGVDDETDFLGITVQPKWRPHLSENIGAYVEARVNAPDIARNRYRDGIDYRMRMLQAYVALHWEKTDIRIGQQIVAWGRADGINPTDNLTPRNYRVMLPLEEDQRFGIAALKIDRALTDAWTLSTFVSPFFTPSRIPVVTGNYSIVEERPARTFDNTEIGVRLDRTGTGLDGSVSFYRGYNLLPNFRGAVSSPSTLVEYYDKVNVIGADIAANLDRFGLRAEVAYSHPESSGTPNSRLPQWFYVIGADRTFSETLNVNVQLVGRHIEAYRDPAVQTDPTLAGTGTINAIINNQQSQTSYGISSRISDRWYNDTVSVELLLYVGLTRSDTYLRPLITYAIDDHAQVMCGAEIYHGSDNSLFGRLAKNSGPFIELRYNF